jgi:hypothetical protein
MDLLTFRIIGHPAIPDSSWLKVGRGINVLRTGHRPQAGGLLRMLQTINPPYNFEQVQPFADLPSHTSSQQCTKKIMLSKKTAALAIFVASPQLVTELTAIDAVFYETDRIEFGRRRDFSQWISFVELSESTRWSEIEPTVRLLLSRSKLEMPAVAGLQTTIESLRGVDRIKDQRATQLKKLLQGLRQGLHENEQPLLDQCLHAIDRDQHFRRAKEVLTSRLPLFLSISGTDLPSGEKLQAMLTALVSLHEKHYGGPPFFLFDFSELKLERPKQAVLLKTLLGYASRLQCLVAPSDLFLELCADVLKEMKKNEQPLITFIDVPRGTAH